MLNTVNALQAQRKSAAQKGASSETTLVHPVDDINFIHSLTDDLSLADLLRVLR
jgi:hypothetical protein